MLFAALWRRRRRENAEPTTDALATIRASVGSKYAPDHLRSKTMHELERDFRIGIGLTVCSSVLAIGALLLIGYLSEAW
jgi:hypothetical protein